MKVVVLKWTSLNVDFLFQSKLSKITVTKQHHKKQWLMIQTNRRTILDFRIRFGSTDWRLQFLIILYLFRGLMEASLSLYRANKTHTLTASHWQWLFLLTAVSLLHKSKLHSESKVTADSVWFLSTFCYMIHSQHQHLHTTEYMFHISALCWRWILSYSTSQQWEKLNWIPHSLLSVFSHRHLH